MWLNMAKYFASDEQCESFQYMQSIIMAFSDKFVDDI